MSDSEYPVFRPIDGPWVALLIIGILMFLFSVVGIALLFVVWRRFKQPPSINDANPVLNNKPNGNISIPVQYNDRAPQSYETQKMEVFVPQVDEAINQRHLDEFYPRFAPDDAMKTLQNTYQRTTRAYF